MTAKTAFHVGLPFHGLKNTTVTADAEYHESPGERPIYRIAIRPTGAAATENNVRPSGYRNVFDISNLTGEGISVYTGIEPTSVIASPAAFCGTLSLRS